MTAAALHLIDQAARFSRWGRPRAAIDAYRQACATPLDDGARYVALTGLARSFEAVGEDKRAIELCHEAIRTAPDQAPAYGILALLLVRAGRLDRAAAAAVDACLHDHRSAAMLCLSASIALRRGRIDEALDTISLALVRDPGSQRARAFRGIAEYWRDGAKHADTARLVRVSDPPAPAGFTSIAVFNRALTDEIRAHEMLESGDNGPLVNGARLHGLFTLAPALAEALRAMFLAEALHYPAALTGCDAPSQLGVRGWANVMKAGAYEDAHIHEGGWLSAVYYPELPGRGSTGGEIVFGPHDLGPEVPSIPPYRVSPAKGRMVVFPSWLHHSTLPFTGEGLRISVAADILPV